MSTYTKEQLIARINQVTAINKYRISRDPDADGLAMDNELLVIALASLEAEPVAFRAKLQPPSAIGSEQWDYTDHRQPDAFELENCSIECLYTAPPAPVSVPDELAGKSFNYIANKFQVSTSEAQWILVGWNARSAAMLQGAEPDFREISNSSTKHFRENAETSTKCWCQTCHPVTIDDMRFVVCSECGNKRCPHANDHRNACTGSNEPGQEGNAYPAAQQHSSTAAGV